ncbi:importin subunit alpha-9 [Populus trichocarpa]|uniref:importin subunit alpha-9 n=1 Tax=Populus trichocarpa TaxID=3694 RepID=UPI0022785733|nr:importin subunit alpha-9 [Populus trichocarpa]
MNVILRNVYVELPNGSGVERHVSEHYLSSVFSPYQEKGVMQKLVGALRELRCLLSKSEFPLVDAALKAGAIALLVQCLSFGSPDEQLLEAAWSLTNIAAGKSEETKALLPTLPLLIAYLGGL